MIAIEAINLYVQVSLVYRSALSECTHEQGRGGGREYTLQPQHMLA